MKLYEIDEQVMTIDEETGEIIFNNTEEHERLLFALISRYKNKTAEAKILKEESKRLLEESKLAEEQAEKAKKYILGYMQTQNVKKVDNGIHFASVRAGSGAVNILEESLISDKFIKEEIVKKIDKTSIKEALKNGESVDGAELIYNDSVIIK